VGVPEPGATALTVAENVTGCPSTEGFAELLTAVALPALPTVWVGRFPVLAAKFESPRYLTVTVCAPTLRLEIAGKDADPAIRVTGVPTFAPSITSCTCPVGVPTPGATALTVAENVTACPNTEGFTELLTAVAELAWLTV
jgi:hypothetical protein